MMHLKKMLPHILVSLAIIGWWRMLTWTDNYAWSPEGKELLILEPALWMIFIYKTLFWLVLANLTVYSIKRLFKNEYKSVIEATVINLGFYFVAGNFVASICSPWYYRVFSNQSVAEGYLQKPIQQAGYEIGPIVTSKIKNKNMRFRRYAIDGLADIHYYPAIETLKQMLFDKSENAYVRADAFVSLTKFDTTAAKKVVADFKTSAADSVDKGVITLGNYFLRDNSKTYAAD